MGAMGHADHAAFGTGTVDHSFNGFDPEAMLRDFDWGRTRRLPGGRVLREWDVVAQDREIEVAPGVRYAAWTYNGRVPGPTLRCREGERLRIRFVNASTPPAHDALPRRPLGLHGRDAGDRRGARRRADRAR